MVYPNPDPRPKTRDPVFDDPKNRTVPQDPRYHNTNVTKWCFATFVDYKRCLRLLGEKNECCDQFQKIYQAICPNEWVETWEEQIQDSTFPVDLPPQKKENGSVT